MKQYLISIRDNYKQRTVLCFLLWVILASLSFAVFNLPFIWIAYIPLIYAIHQMTLQDIIKYGFFFYFLYYLCTLFWLIAFHELSIIFVFPLYALYGTAATILIRYTSLRFPKIRFLMFPLFWTAFEIFRGSGFLGFRWNTPADALWKQLVFLQSADVIGSWGVSFIILLVNSTIAEVLLDWKKGTTLYQSVLKNILPLYLTVFIFLANLAYGIRSMHEWKNIIENKLYREKIALIQPNRPGHSSWYKNQAELSEKYLEMTQSVAEQKPDLILQTEIMISTYLWENLKVYGKDNPENYYLNQFIEQSKTLDTPIMLTHFGIDGRGRSYNSATLVSYSNNTYQTNTYNKIHIVPFGEWVPGSSKWKWLDRILTQLGAAWASPGEKLTIFTSKNGILYAMLICFEDIYAILGRLFVDKGAQYFVNSTNDGWAYRWKFGSKIPLWQHLANTTHTAISLRRSIARAVNTGVSAVVDPMGRMDIAPIKEYEAGVYIAEVPVMPKGFRSQYVIRGWYLEYMIFFTAIFFALFVLITDKKSILLKKIL